jgi:hypothetical protein
VGNTSNLLQKLPLVSTLQYNLADMYLVERFMHFVVKTRQVQLTNTASRQFSRVYDTTFVELLMQAVDM